jgi:hypothetical protein
LRPPFQPFNQQQLPDSRIDKDQRIFSNNNKRKTPSLLPAFP